MSKLRKLLLILAIPLPQPLKQAIYRRLGWRIGRGVKIGLSYIDGLEVTFEDQVTIGHFNVFKQMKRLHVGQESLISNFNEAFGTTYGPEWPGELQIGANVNFMSRHFVDAAGSVIIGDRCVVAGRETQFWSHQMALVDGVSELKPLRVCVGPDAYIGARAMLLGCNIPAGAMVGAGSVVAKSFPPEPCRLLIAGNPAVIKKRYQIGEVAAEADAGTESVSNVTPVPDRSALSSPPATSLPATSLPEDDGR
jgi:acetyltransferase-like isoleucine patch superfamily enzyme